MRSDGGQGEGGPDLAPVEAAVLVPGRRHHRLGGLLGRRGEHGHLVENVVLQSKKDIKACILSHSLSHSLSLILSLVLSLAY
jgi:hypothetical protein